MNLKTSKVTLKRKRVKNVLNADSFEKVYETSDQPSLTVPDQTMSIREIITRYSRGLPIEGARVPIYDEGDDMPDIKHLDLAERQEIAEGYREELAQIEERKKKRKQKVTQGGGEALAVYTGEGKPVQEATQERPGQAKQPDTPANL